MIVKFGFILFYFFLSKELKLYRKEMVIFYFVEVRGIIVEKRMGIFVILGDF